VLLLAAHPASARLSMGTVSSPVDHPQLTGRFVNGELVVRTPRREVPGDDGVQRPGGLLIAPHDQQL